MPTPYDLYKDDHQFIDEIESIVVHPFGNNGELPDDSLAVPDVQAHRADLSNREHGASGGLVAFDPKLQGWIIFADVLNTAGGYVIKSGVYFIAGGQRWNVTAAKLGVFNTRYLVQAELQPVVAA